MASAPRSETVLDGQVEIYHCYSRCVRQSWLCGKDHATGRDFSHRRKWVKAFAERLAGLLPIDVAFFAVMVNHCHFILRSRPDLVDHWSDEEVVRRYMTVNRLVKSSDGQTITEPTDVEVRLEAKDAERVAMMRKKLAHVSMFMGSLSENIAIRANRDDQCQGHFWQGRYKCRRLESAAAAFVCALYIDLNQIRAGEAGTPEESIHTSAYLRLSALLAQQTAGEGIDGWLCPLTLDEAPNAYVGPDPGSTSKRRASDRGLLPISLEEYLKLLDWAGRSPKEGKAGAIPADLEPILTRLGVNEDRCLEVVDHFNEMFGRVVGTAAVLAQCAADAGRRWYAGAAACRAIFK